RFLRYAMRQVAPDPSLSRSRPGTARERVPRGEAASNLAALSACGGPCAARYRYDHAPSGSAIGSGGRRTRPRLSEGPAGLCLMAVSLEAAARFTEHFAADRRDPPAKRRPRTWAAPIG